MSIEKLKEQMGRCKSMITTFEQLVETKQNDIKYYTSLIEEQKKKIQQLSKKLENYLN